MESIKRTDVTVKEAQAISAAIRELIIRQFDGSRNFSAGNQAETYGYLCGIRDKYDEIADGLRTAPPIRVTDPRAAAIADGTVGT